jgi:glycosyltransferase involved in cell wall biosynthesis
MQKVLRELGVTAKIEVVPNGIDLGHFQNAVPLERSLLGFSENDILLVYAGRVAREKNMEFLLTAFAEVTPVVKNLRLLIIGDGQKQVVDDIKALPAKLGITERVVFTGLIAYDRLPAYLAMCDIFVTASVSEVHPLSVIEAMSAGLPVVGIHSPGISDTVEDGKTGFLTAHDRDAYTTALTRLSLDPGLIHRMGAAAREASNAYAVESTMLKMLGHYERLLSQPKPDQPARPAGVYS